MLDHSVDARRIDDHGILGTTKTAAITLDTDVEGRDDAFRPAELFLAAGAKPGPAASRDPVSPSRRPLFTRSRDFYPAPGTPERSAAVLDRPP